MKQKLFTLQPLVTVVLCMAMAFTSCGNDGEEEPDVFDSDLYDTIVDGIGYRIESLDDMTAEVVYTTVPNTYSGSVTIPSSVTINGRAFKVVAVGSECFAQSNVTSVNLPNTIEQIRMMAFYRCKTLKSIKIPSSVFVIDKAAFYESGLESITIPANVRLYI